MKKAKRRKPARRKSGSHKNMTVGAALKRISKLFQIPRQAITLAGPNRRKVSANAKLSRLRAGWD